MRRIPNYNDEHFMLLGDAGFPLRPWLMTPLPDLLENSPEARFNNAFCLAHSIIERVNGILKMRFRCLFKHRVLHYTPTTAAKIVNTCAVFHNMAIIDGYQPAIGAGEQYMGNMEWGMFNNENVNEINEQIGRVNPELAAGRNLRQQIVRNWFI